MLPTTLVTRALMLQVRVDDAGSPYSCSMAFKNALVEDLETLGISYQMEESGHKNCLHLYKLQRGNLLNRQQLTHRNAQRNL
jgi:hypothetical protein